MAPKGQVETEAPNERIYDTVAAVAARYGYEAPTFEHTAVGAVYPNRNEARTFRFGNAAFRSLNLPKVDGKGGMDTANKSVFTSRFNWGEWDLETAAEHVFESGQFGAAVEEYEEHAGCSEEHAADVCLFSLMLVAKGWVREMEIAGVDGISKLWETNDVSGQDVQVGDEHYQVRSWKWGINNGWEETDKNGNPVIYYAAAGDTVHYGTDGKAVAKKKASAYGIGLKEMAEHDLITLPAL